MVKDLLLSGKSSPRSGGSGFPLSLSDWSFTICLMPYNHKYNLLSEKLNIYFHPSFLPIADDKLENKQTVVSALTANFASLSNNDYIYGKT